MITQSSKQCYRALEMLYGIHPLPINAIGHAQQIECFCHALGVMQRFKQGKCFLMRMQTLCSAPGIDQPVPDAVEATSMEFGIGQRLREIK